MLLIGILLFLVIITIWYIRMDQSASAVTNTSAKKEHMKKDHKKKETMINEAQIADIARGYNENRLLYATDYYDAVTTLSDAEHADHTSDIVLETWGN